jgi:hypothetical protein
MKKFIVIICTLLLFIKCGDYTIPEKINISNTVNSNTVLVTDLSTLVIKDSTTYILTGNFTSDKSFPFKSGSLYHNVIITGNWSFHYTGNAKAFSFGGTNILIENGIITTTGSASSALEFWNSNNVTINRMDLSTSKWGIRGFSDTNVVIMNTTVCNTWDDGIYLENMKNVEIGYCMFKNNNYSYWEDKVGGGDCVQIAGRQGFIYVHDNYFTKVQNGGKFNLIIGASTYTGNDSALVERNVFNARPYQMRELEDTTNHVVNGTSCLFLKYFTKVDVIGNSFFGGSNAIYTWGSATNKRYLTVLGNVFRNQLECISFGSNWTLKVINNTFYEGITTYLRGDGSGDYISKNIFYGLENPKINLFNSYTFVDNLINPLYELNGYGVYGALLNGTECTDTVTVYNNVYDTIYEYVPQIVPIYDTINILVSTNIYDTIFIIKEVEVKNIVYDTVEVKGLLQNLINSLKLRRDSIEIIIH